MLLKKHLAVAIAALTTTPVVTQAETKVSAILQNETAVYLNNGPRTGLSTSIQDTKETDSGDVMKSKSTAKLFIDHDFGESSSWHSEFNLAYDSEAIDGYKGSSSYTENDILRELYLDTQTAGWDLRLGKQQIAWGANNILNPTDFRELNQNMQDESRIPVWMVNAKRKVGENSNIQFIVSQAEENKIPGLDADGDSGHPFIMKGVDSITGKVNGFLNIMPEFAAVSSAFFNNFSGTSGGLNGQTTTTVQNFVDGTLNGSAESLAGTVDSTGAITNLIDSNWDPNDPNSAFEYMNNASFATFDTFVGATSEYRKKTPDNPANLGFRFEEGAERGMNYSLSYMYAYDPNPSVSMHWENSSGEELDVVTSTSGGVTTVDLQDKGGNTYGGAAGRAATLVFEEENHRSHYLGASFNTPVNTQLGPMMLQSEVLYQKGAHLPVVDRTKLGYGDLTGAIQIEEADMLKLALGAGFTVAENTMLNGQLIHTANLDYVEDNAGCAEANCGRYTADPTTMHLSNGLQKGREYDTFAALFISHPYGSAEADRINNLLMYEQGGGYWNQLNAGYSLSDAVILTGEVNLYFGDEDTTFGQFENSSNAQAGLKWIL